MDNGKPTIPPHVIKPGLSMGGGLVARPGMKLSLALENFWHFVNWRRPKGCDCKGCQNWRRLPAKLHEFADIFCRNAYVAWAEEVPNLVTTEGKNDLLTKYFKDSAYTAAWYLGLVDNAGFTAYAAGDTAAEIGGTNGWAEAVPYSNANRITWLGGAAAGGSIDNLGSPAAFNINANATVRGGFVISDNTKNGTSGVLYGEADFAAARSVLVGDTLNVTSTMTAA